MLWTAPPPALAGALLLVSVILVTVSCRMSEAFPWGLISPQLQLLACEMVRPVLFVDVEQNLRSGSTLLRTHQLWQLSKRDLDDVGAPSAVTTSLEHRDSILVLNKNT